ncbi:unnamed protein product [Nesidiocoris tenuis]|uniref:Uncharacterized protein n=1 Tax=Nesidiocoris tenuis TaxID=355587 RepID=A0A6H5GJE4_9HEMI|nr:unnamed protein product [Nesidiocoris tenuis]
MEKRCTTKVGNTVSMTRRNCQHQASSTSIDAVIIKGNKQHSIILLLLLFSLVRVMLDTSNHRLSYD